MAKTAFKKQKQMDTTMSIPDENVQPKLETSWHTNAIARCHSKLFLAVLCTQIRQCERFTGVYK